MRSATNIERSSTVKTPGALASKFTFTYGVRWEIYTPESVNGKGNGGFANLSNGSLGIAGYTPINLNGNVQNTYKAFAPRLGAAYQFDAKTVLRHGLRAQF